jgi:3-deoxy-7-phosphoheptulonate synthase
MIIQLQFPLASEKSQAVAAQLKQLGYSAQPVQTQYGHYFVALGKAEFDIRRLSELEAIKDIHRVSDNYKLVSRKWKVAPTVIDLGDGIHIGDGELAIMSGPCSIESEAQIARNVAHLVAQGVRIMRGGVFKPRSSPYSFRGMGLEGLQMFYQACRAAGIKIITEVMQVSQIAEMVDYIDIFQVGARNVQNFNLLEALGGVDKPVMLKRGISGTIEELLQAAEYVFMSGNERLLLCERGIRTFETASRNTLDLNAVPILKEKSHLPVIVDPSHGIGLRRHVGTMALAAVMAGADGIIVEVHEQPEKALSDGAQTLDFEEAAVLYGQLRAAFALRQSFE